MASAAVGQCEDQLPDRNASERVMSCSMELGRAEAALREAVSIAYDEGIRRGQSFANLCG